MKRGSIYWVNLESSDKPEFGKTRPCLVVSNTEHNIRLPTVVVIPLSSQKPEIWPLRLKIQLPNHKESFAVLPGIRQVSKSRLGKVIGACPPTILHHIDEAMCAYLND